MAEYINREKIFPNGVFYVNKNQPEKSLDELINRICKAPVADVVEVVRCKDCIYHNVPPCPMRLSLNWTNDNDFCSYGERRLDNDKSPL